MVMYNPPSVGEFIEAVYIESLGISCDELATRLAVSTATLNCILEGKSGISPEMALRLSEVLGRSPESWLVMQGNFELWQAR